MRITRVFLLILVAGILTSCLGPKGDTKAEQKAFIDKMANETLAKLYKEEPEAKSRMNKMAGYAVFSNINNNLFLLSTGSGYGVAHGGGKKVYMKMFSLGVGVGIGIKDFRAVFMFRDQETFKRFVEEGWEFGGSADAAAISDQKGGEASGQVSADSDIVVYSITEAGVAIQAAIAGTKYWKNDELN